MKSECDTLEMDNVKEREMKELAILVRRSELSVDLVMELLSGLPFKKVLQCMFVSKVWRSVIRQPTFVQDYFGNLSFSRDFLLSIPERNRLHFCYSASAVHNKLENYNELFRDRRFDYSGVTQAVNGLFCFYNQSRVFLANVFSGETMELPDSTSSVDTFFPSSDFHIACKYSFGFDPVNRVYKLLCTSTTWNRFSNGCVSRSSILTIAHDSLWRKLAAPKFNFLRNQGLFVNGVLYWIHEGRLDGLISFNLTEEKFCSVRLPAIEGKKWVGLVQFRGLLSLFVTLDQTIIFHTLKDKEGYVWSEHRVILPAGLGRSYHCNLVPIGTLFTGEIVLTGELVVATNPTTMPAFSYNYKNQKFQKISIAKFPKSVDLTFKTRVAGLLSSVPENIETLEAIIHGGTIGSY